MSQLPGSASVPRPIVVAASWAWRLIAIGVAVYVVVRGLAAVAVIVIPVGIALLLTGLMRPGVHALQRRSRLPRGAASGIVLIGSLLVVVAALALAGSTIADADQFNDMRREASTGIDKVLDWLATGPLRLDSAAIQGYVDTAREQLSANSGRIFSGAMEVGVTVGHVFAGIAICLFATYFFLAQGEQIWRWCLSLFPASSRDRTNQAALRGWLTLTSYIRAHLLIAATDAVGIALGAAILGLPFIFPLAVIAFFGALIPFAGAIVVGTFATLVALVVKGPVIALVMLGIVILVIQLEGHILQPFLMGHAVRLHPLAVLLVVAAGALIAGIVGAFFAVPITAVANNVTRYLFGKDPFPDLAAAAVNDSDDFSLAEGPGSSGSSASPAPAD